MIRVVKEAFINKSLVASQMIGLVDQNNDVIRDIFLLYAKHDFASYVI